ncbi:hypothetical protein GcM1_229008 [Golovinomyces cichoracearum]|uniref:Opy2 protein n=1 Tax=Golovinomyces cichoracearum TaxID=62708 RepID=A0A420IND5_9PEZI|nr:hypothetical protein GcM1_229008 [Golovinomyces cichoracearum]
MLVTRSDILVPKPSSSRAHDIGTIVGSTFAGITAVTIITYAIWRCCIKIKRPQSQGKSLSDYTVDSYEGEKSFTAQRDARASTHTVASIASTVLTRASNIIQIAYIPGVTNRSCPNSPGFLVPPVPPIPLALTSNYGSTVSVEQEHFFMPSDLRDSTYSTLTSQTSFERDSVASTIYGKNAIVSPLPAQRGIRGKAAVVSVKSAAASEQSTPIIANLDFFEAPLPSPAFSVGSTFLSRASAATHGKAQIIRVLNNSSDQRNVTQTDLNSPSSQASSFFNDSPPSTGNQTLHDSLHSWIRSPRTNSTSEHIRKIAPSKDSRKKVSTPFGDENRVE